VAQGFHAAHDALSKEAAIDWMLRARDNPSAVRSSIGLARQNARLVRTALTGEVWEAMNRTYMGSEDRLARRVSERDLPKVLGLVRQGTALVRGATLGTMLRNDIYDFARLGTFLERADNTARILDVKYYVLLPGISAVGSTVDNVQWETILRSVSARGGFRMEYGTATEPRNIAQFLILDKRMPRSLAFCALKLRDNLQYLASNYGQKPPSLALADELVRRFLTHDIEAVFDFGLHEYIEEVIGALDTLGRQIEIDFRFYE
jgi:uncharacterized alpha-E superfamily protein